eukprot:7522955-Karenia_brevis.AAC.1
MHGVPAEKHMRVDRATWLVMLRRRLRAPLTTENSRCQLPKQRQAADAEESSDGACGEMLGKHARHSCHCPCGPWR